MKKFSILLVSGALFSAALVFGINRMHSEDVNELTETTLSVSSEQQKHDEVCPQCKGTGRVTCRGCNGSGRQTCSGCQGKGYNPYSSKRTDCSICNGKGTIRCRTCYGNTTLSCNRCQGRGRV